MKKQTYSVSLTGWHQGVATRITASPVAGYTVDDAVMDAILTAFGVRPRPTRSTQGTMRGERPYIFFHWNDNDGPHVFVTEHETIEEMAQPCVASEAETPAAPDGRAYTPDAYQRQCLATWGSAGDSLREQRLHALLGLVGEAGETADLLKKHFFKPGREATPEQVRDELADVAYYLAVNAHLWGWTLDDLFAHLGEKLAGGHGWTTETPSKTPSNSTGLEVNRE